MELTTAVLVCLHYPARSHPLIQISSTVGSSQWRCKVRDDLIDQPSYGEAVLDRVQATAADELTDLRLTV